MKTASLAAGLRANSSIPYGVIPVVMQAFGHIASSLSSLMQNELVQSLESVGVDSVSANKVKKCFADRCQPYSKPWNFCPVVTDLINTLITIISQ
jgi:hypothetical protein